MTKTERETVLYIYLRKKCKSRRDLFHSIGLPSLVAGGTSIHRNMMDKTLLLAARQFIVLLSSSAA